MKLSIDRYDLRRDILTGDKHMQQEVKGSWVKYRDLQILIKDLFITLDVEEDE